MTTEPPETYPPIGWFGPVRFVLRFLAMLIWMIVCVALHYLVERPMRRLINGWRGNLPVFGATLAVVLLAALGGFQMRQSWYPAADADSIASGGLFIDHGGDRTVTLIGDSHAAMYARALARVTSELGVNLQVLASPSRNHLPGAQASLWPDIRRAVEDFPPDVVIMTHKWSFMLAPGSPALCESLRFLVPRTGQVILLTQPPYLPFTSPREVVRKDNQGPFLEQERIHQQRVTGNMAVRAAGGANVTVIDAASLFEQSKDSVLQMMKQVSSCLCKTRSRLTRPRSMSHVVRSIP
ncbi:SGNH hydrolase domain-containing protein, partial [uncultured Parasphingopyxis sp.]|uniref:SGNH hydrolase domain-containing protein n=1 Tax=uncultured Parasphingopyxis sp. TaxID=1547918 RepID=UPI002610B27B